MAVADVVSGRGVGSGDGGVGLEVGVRVGLEVGIRVGDGVYVDVPDCVGVETGGTVAIVVVSMGVGVLLPQVCRRISITRLRSV